MRVRVEYKVAGAERLITVLKLPLDYTPDLGEVMAVSSPASYQRTPAFGCVGSSALG